MTRLLPILLMAPLMLLPPAASAGSSHARTVHVTIREYHFSPATLHLRVGETVIWTNRDADQHTVTGDGPAHFRSRPLGQGATFRVTVTRAGVFHYHCAFHPFMVGTLVVRR